MSGHLGLKIGAGVTVGAVFLGGAYALGNRGEVNEITPGQQQVLDEAALGALASDAACGKDFNYDTFIASSYAGVDPNSLFKGLQTKDEDGESVAIPTEESRISIMSQLCINAASTSVAASFLVAARTPGLKFEDATSLESIAAIENKLVTDKTYAAEMLSDIKAELQYQEAETDFSFSNATAKAIAPTLSKTGETTGLQYVKGNFVRPQDGWRFGYNTDDSSMSSVERASLDQQMLTFAVNKEGQWIVAQTTGEGKVKFDKDATNTATATPSASESEAAGTASETQGTASARARATSETSESPTSGGTQRRTTRPTPARSPHATTPGGGATSEAPAGGGGGATSEAPAGGGGGESTPPAGGGGGESTPPAGGGGGESTPPAGGGGGESTPPAGGGETTPPVIKGSEPPADCVNNPFDTRC